MIIHEATCSCGQLCLSCEGDPLRISMCHCLECQRRTGSTFGVQAWFSRDRVSVPLGTAKHYVRRADSGRLVTFNFCPACGGTVFWYAEQRAELIAVAVGAFADATFQKPGFSVWEKRRHPWIAAIDQEVIDHSE